MKSIICSILMLLIIHTAARDLTVYAQNMGHTVKQKTVKFAKGKNSTIIPGRADYGMSYVYIVNARKDQFMEINVTSKDSSVSFSLFAPETITDNQLAFNKTGWKGRLPESGNYQIVLVMNEENMKNVPYSIAVQIK